MNATWSPYCYAWQNGPAGSLYHEYEDNDHVKFLTALIDPDEPYSCAEWGDMPVGGGSQIIHDIGVQIFELFNSSNLVPSMVWIDHEMRVYDMTNSAGTWTTTTRIDQMLEACGDLCESNPCNVYAEGDINLDTSVNVQDVIVLIGQILESLILEGCALEAADMNADGSINVQDVVVLINLI